MHKTFAVLSALICFSASLAQYIEKVIDLPRGSGPGALCYVPTVQKVYCSLKDSVTVIDANADSVLGYFVTGDGPYAMCYNPTNDKLYVANLEDSSVAVVDPTSDTILAVVHTDDTPYELLYNVAMNKVYSANYHARSVSIIDGATNELIRTINEVGTRFLCCNSSGTKVFSADIGTGFVIDGTLDLKVDSFPVGNKVQDIMYVPALEKVYATEFYDNAVWVIDAVADTLIRTVTVGDSNSQLCFNAQDNKVYCGVWGSSRVMVMDATDDTLIGLTDVGARPFALCHDSVNNKVYCANLGDSVVHIIDGHTDTVVAVCTTGVGPKALAWVPDLSKMFVANYYGGSVAVIRDTTAVGVREPRSPRQNRARRTPTIARGATAAALYGATLYDIHGRRVAVLCQGDDYSALLRPGVYMARTVGGLTAKTLVVR